MANSKISALTSATTPLAGTETLPIVQSGTTKQVSVANLTAGRSVAVKDITATSTSGTLATFTRTGISSLVIGADTAGPLLAPATVDAIQIYNAAQTVQRFVVNTAIGNLEIKSSGGGINFTANAPQAGMTSQLLNWYEEGTWTPNQGAGLTVVGAFSSSGKYTRIGRQVSVSGTVAGATSVAVAATGVITSNLPFTVGTAGHGDATNTAVNASATVICTSTNVTSAAAIVATATITFSATYFV